jgi:hypothetical protein
MAALFAKARSHILPDGSEIQTLTVQMGDAPLDLQPLLTGSPTWDIPPYPLGGRPWFTLEVECVAGDLASLTMIPFALGQAVTLDRRAYLGVFRYHGSITRAICDPVNLPPYRYTLKIVFDAGARISAL